MPVNINDFKFNNLQLDDLLLDNAQVIQDMAARVEQISKDLATLEELLTKMPLSDCELNLGVIDLEPTKLVWGRSPTSHGKRRLMVVKYDHAQGEMIKNLAETKMDVRLSVGPYFADFLQLAIDTAKSKVYGTKE